MTCLHCKGRMKRGVAPLSMDRHGYHIAWDALPAWVCTQCGEPYFESREVELVQQALASIDEKMDRLAAAGA